MRTQPQRQLKGLLTLFLSLTVGATTLWSSLWATTRVVPAPTDVGLARAPFSDAASGPQPPAPPPPSACRYKAGARAMETLGLPPSGRRAIPITHVIVVVQENRSFDHYFGKLADAGQPSAEGRPPNFVNADRQGRSIAPFHLPSTCVPVDPPHQWASMHAHWNGGRMDGFVTEADEEGNGRWSMGYYDARDLPFYYWLARTFSLSDRYFSPAMGGTWPNRQILYTGTAQSQRAPTGLLEGTRTLFGALDAARVAWRVYTDGPPRQDCIGWQKNAPGVEPVSRFLASLAAGTLPPVSFVDPSKEDEHPPADVQRGERWERALYLQMIRSPLWPHLAAFLTYDEGGGFVDHVPPPAACPPSPDRSEYDRRGTRVPLIVVSPWARPHFVSHEVSDHASVLRFIELLFDLPALSDRDANADALLDRFDFKAPPLLHPPPAPQAGHGGCRSPRLAGR